MPFIVRFPGTVEPGTQMGMFAYVRDVVPTLLELAGVDVPEGTYDGREIYTLDGISMLPVLQGEVDTVRTEEHPVGHELDGSSAVFKGRWKLVQNLAPKGTGAWELYNIEDDPSERHDLASANPERVADLRGFYDQRADDVNLVPVPEGYNPLEQTVINAKRNGAH